MRKTGLAEAVSATKKPYVFDEKQYLIFIKISVPHFVPHGDALLKPHSHQP